MARQGMASCCCRWRGRRLAPSRRVLPGADRRCVMARASCWPPVSSLSLGGSALLAVAHGDGGAGAARLELRFAQSYDLAGALRADPLLQLPLLEKSDPKLAGLLRSRGVPRYSVQRLNPVVADPPTSDAIQQAPPRGVIFRPVACAGAGSFGPISGGTLAGLPASAGDARHQGVLPDFCRRRWRSRHDGKPEG